MAETPTAPELGFKAPDFHLMATDGRAYGLSDVMGENGAVIVFICNHCPYVRAITDRLVAAADELREVGIGFAAICSNDSESHPTDSFENMRGFAQQRRFTFPYLHDKTQQVARAFDAVCTPDFFGLNGEGLVQYRGRLDEGRTDPPPEGAKRELVDAMRRVAETGEGPEEQIPSVGCGIKWKAAA